MNQTLQTFYLLNDVVVQLQLSQILKLPQAINLQDILSHRGEKKPTKQITHTLKTNQTKHK